MTIADVGKKYGLSADTLRHYERIGLIPGVNRGRCGIRDYTEDDCQWVEYIKCMRSACLPIEALIEYMGLFQQGDETIEARKQILIGRRVQIIERIEELKKSLELLNYKIERYEQVMVPKEKEL
jgi:DNA-binding transcriptional MerR regulator